MMSATRRARVENGLCPRCGKEAAPYYLCSRCRLQSRIMHVLNRAAKAGGFKKERKGRESFWSIGDEKALASIKWRRELLEGDKRSLPRLGRVPVAVEAELINLLISLGRPATLEEIIVAWGGLREKRKTASVAQDMARLITAQRKRERRAEKYMRIAQRASA